MTSRLPLILALCASLCSDAWAQQQTPNSVVGGYYNSGTPTFTPGAAVPLQVDINGNLKTTGGGGGGGTVTQGPPGTAGSAWYVQPGTGATFPITGSISNTAFGITGAIPAGANSIGTVGLNAGANSIGTVQPGNTPNTTPWLANPTTQYPSGATAITASATGTTAATTATLAGVAANYTFICGFSIRANATAAVTGNSTVTGTISGTMNYTQWTAPLASGLGVTEEIFTPCVPASAVNTPIAVTSAAPGAGGTVSVTAWGYQKTTTP